MKYLYLLIALLLLSCDSEESGSPEIVVYSGTIEEEETEPSITTTIDGKPVSPSDSMSKVIAANTKPEAVPADSVVPAHPVADPFPGEPGFVINPWTKEKVDVRGLPEGTLIRDPKDPNPDHKFRVPSPSVGE